jgi:hypothetical protein
MGNEEVGEIGIHINLFQLGPQDKEADGRQHLAESRAHLWSWHKTRSEWEQ